MDRFNDDVLNRLIWKLDESRTANDAAKALIGLLDYVGVWTVSDPAPGRNDVLVHARNGPSFAFNARIFDNDAE